MTNNNNNNSCEQSYSSKRIKPRYINIRENIYAALSNDAMAVYIALRFEADYSNDISSVDRNIQFLCNKAKIKKTRCKECLLELEKNGLAKIEYNPGYQSTYWIADELGHFLPKDQPNIAPEEIDQPHREPIDPPRQTIDPPRQTTDINTNPFTNPSSLKPIVDSDKSTSHKDDAFFMQFYSLYPNKEKPSIARKAFYQHSPTQEFVDMICNDVRLRIENNWKGRHKNKIPHPATYLNQKEWEGEIYTPESNVSKIATRTKYKTMEELTYGLDMEALGELMI